MPCYGFIIGETPSIKPVYRIEDGGMGPILWNGRPERISFALSGNEVTGTPASVRYELNLLRAGDSLYVIEMEALNEIGSSRPPLLVRHDDVASFEVRDGWARWEELKDTVTLMSEVRGPIAPTLRDVRYNLFSWSIHDDFHSEKRSVIRQARVARHDEQLDPDGQNLASVLLKRHNLQVDMQS